MPTLLQVQESAMEHWVAGKGCLVTDSQSLVTNSLSGSARKKFFTRTIRFMVDFGRQGDCERIGAL